MTGIDLVVMEVEWEWGGATGGVVVMPMVVGGKRGDGEKKEERRTRKDKV